MNTICCKWGKIGYGVIRDCVLTFVNKHTHMGKKTVNVIAKAPSVVISEQWLMDDFYFVCLDCIFSIFYNKHVIRKNLLRKATHVKRASLSPTIPFVGIYPAEHIET